MNIYDFYLTQHRYFTPRTPNTALLSLKKGLIPKESLISISLFLNSPFGVGNKFYLLSETEEFERINELERILAKKDLDISTELILLTTLEKLVEHINPEIALYAAESLNSIENRYNKSIYTLSKVFEKNNSDQKVVTELIQTLYNYGFINMDKEEIKHYYFNKALIYFDYLLVLNEDFLEIKIKIYNDLRRFDESRETLNSIDLKQYHKYKIILLRMETEFEAKNFQAITEIAKDCNYDEIPEGYREKICKWRN
ncbi:MAG: hypothetical protein JXR64_08620 [Spirochaetales bacterium]|nr:hypothetical protein [Spirochaetales bacterium]